MKTLHTLLDKKLAAQVAKVSTETKLSVDDLIRHGLRNLALEFEETGVVAVTSERQKSPSIDPVLSRRFAELDDKLELAPGHGIADSLLAGLFADFLEGDFALIMDGWVFDDVPKAKAQLARLRKKWNREDKKAA